jgi:hypothetical protein
VVREAAAAFFFLLAGSSRDCGGADEPNGSANAPCTRSRDCASGLICIEGVCTDPDAPDAAAAPRDASDDGG